MLNRTQHTPDNAVADITASQLTPSINVAVPIVANAVSAIVFAVQTARSLIFSFVDCFILIPRFLLKNAFLYKSNPSIIEGLQVNKMLILLYSK